MNKTARTSARPAAPTANPTKSRWGLVGIVLLLVAAGAGYIIAQHSRPDLTPVAENKKEAPPAAPARSAPAPAAQRAFWGFVAVPTGQVWTEVTLAAVPAILSEGMVWVPAGSFEMGDPDPSFPDAKPVHRVQL